MTKEQLDKLEGLLCSMCEVYSISQAMLIFRDGQTLRSRTVAGIGEEGMAKRMSDICQKAIEENRDFILGED
jgi:hypothetical protein